MAHEAAEPDKGFEAAAADAVARLLGRGPHKRIATVVPITGDLTQPEAELWPAVAGTIYNGFVRGIAAGFGGLPPRQGVASRPGHEG